MYWLVRKELSSKSYILGFDFSDEIFKDICSCHLPYKNNYLGCFSGDSLSLLEQNKEVTSLIEVWVSSRLADGSVSFKQYFRVASPDIPQSRLFSFSPRLVYCMIFIAEHKRYKDNYHDTFQSGYVYVPSLIPIP
ncbi:unnamed protein product [Eruca vesicaria subsp. sativa]|uniref:F-box associated beta-propeller type 1 domain-containing protein n=1 Tax=Eruca vesicaria subsp. sativa TaxID=29727 RepID=A0ABC8KG14_ERUVS|nr:unnamed protein product [Eruca vesicaria subsp. sativa]